MNKNSNSLIFKKERISGLFSAIWELSFILLFMYAFYYQTVFKTIDRAMILLSALPIGCMCVYMAVEMKFNFKVFDNSNMGLIVIFILSAMLISKFTSINVNNSELTGKRMLEYVLVGTAMYVYITAYPGRLFNILAYIAIPIFLLSIDAIRNGTETTSFGAIGLEDLNVNVMSSMFIMAVFSLVILLKRAKFFKIIYIAALCLIFYAQIRSASRRGFLIMSLFLFFMILWGWMPLFLKKLSNGKLFVSVVMIIMVAVFVVVLKNYVINDTVLGERLMLKSSSGDKLRKEYQSVAWTLFLSNPLFGCGLNGVANKIFVYSHSMYYELLACTGILGTLIMAYYFFKAITDAYRKSNMVETMGGFDVYIVRATFIFLLCIVASGQAVVMIYDMYFYICLAMVTSILKIADNSLKAKSVDFGD